MTHDLIEPGLLRRTVLTIAALNFGAFFIEMGVALAIGSVSLFADSVDFLEDTSINLLIAMALGWSLARRATAGRVMALVILIPACAALWQAAEKLRDPVAPAVGPLIATAAFAMVVNTVCAWLASRIRHHGGSLTAAAFLSARNDVLVNAAIIVMALVTAAVGTGWPDLVLGVFIIAIAGHAAWEVWETAGEESLAAKALAGEDID
ncbi:cation transporter [Actinomycetota bacterium]